MTERDKITPAGIADKRITPMPIAADGCLPQYEYKTLPNDRYMRYLVLDPGKDDESLSGRLVIEHIDRIPEFDAISYVWGSPDQISQINCDGKVIHLTASLRDALRRVRLPNAVRNLWADQVCINQGDLAERSHQVALMGKIYGKSRTTLVWLGDATDDHTDEVYSLIADVNDMVRAQLLEHNGSWDDMPAVSPKDTITCDRRWASLSRMTDCTWFNRVWVVQEAGLSARPQILYGKRDIDWESCIAVLHWLRHRGSLIAYNFRIEWHAIHLDRLHVWSKANSHQKQVQDTSVLSWSFLDVLHNSRQLAASEPRDHVYAFLGHHAASHTLTGDLIVTPDYTVDVAQVYSDFAIHWLEWTQDLNILSFVQHGQDGTINIALPSWVPTWDGFDGSVISQLGESIFNAGTQSKAVPLLMKEGRCLNVGGIVFDKLLYRSKAFAEQDFRWASGNKDEEWSINDVSKWTEILSHVLNPSRKCVYADDRRLMTCAATLTAGMFSGSLAEFESRATAFLSPYLSAIESQIDYSHIQALEDKAARGDPQLFEMEMAAPLINRRFIVTQNGYYGLAPPTAREGDSCCVIFGARTPFIVRHVADLSSHYEFIGEAYVHGMMKGEIVEMCAAGEFQEEDIILV
jgi:Heterokaryon incompatibility protein (HET)